MERPLMPLSGRLVGRLRWWLAGWMNTAQLLPTGHGTSDVTVRLAAAAYLARFKGQSRVHAESNLRAYLTWCGDHALHPLKRGVPT
jgi:hypothetical protein